MVLCPNPEAIEQRERARHKSGYHKISIDQLQDAVAQTPQRGYWLDNTSLSVAETVATIIQQLPDARIQ
ncbi:MAG: phosphotransferase [Pseudomonadota bacterium]